MPAVWIASEAEAPAVARLLAEFRDWWGKDEPPDDQMLANVERIMEGTDGEFLLGRASEAGEPEGVCQLRFRWSVWRSAEDCYLEDLYVRAAARRSGLGRALIEAAVGRARQRGCRRIELDVNEENHAALALYEASGFVLTPKAPGRTLFISREL
jgi:ribosomal protein S18 acetylase RimI-like enzyme